MPATPPGTSSVEHELRVAARPATVFAYFTDPALIVQWMGAEATIDPRPGGLCRIVFRPTEAIGLMDAAFDEEHRHAVERLGPTRERVMTGAFVAVEPPRRIEFTWGWEEDLYAIPPQSTAVEVTLEPDGEGTLLRLVHTRLPAGPAETFHRGGWEAYLPRLAAVAAGADP